MSKENEDLYNRRFVLKSAGAFIALPFLESLTGAKAFGSSSVKEVVKASTPRAANAVASALSPTGIPKRLVFLPMGYGVHMPNWVPSTSQKGRNYELPELVKGFQDLKQDIYIFNL